MRQVLLLVAVLVVIGGAVHANSGEQNVNFVLEIIQKVLDVIVGFIGDVLDEFVRVIKELMGSGNGE